MIQVKDLWVDLGDFTLKDISLNIERAAYFIILGPTGAGKTVLLESIAGLYPIRSGQIWLKGKEVTHLEPEKRNISIVYQDHALFPHMSVAENIVFGLKIHKRPRQQLEETLKWILDYWRSKIR